MTIEYHKMSPDDFTQAVFNLVTAKEGYEGGGKIYVGNDRIPTIGYGTALVSDDGKVLRTRAELNKEFGAAGINFSEGAYKELQAIAPLIADKSISSGAILAAVQNSPSLNLLWVSQDQAADIVKYDIQSIVPRDINSQLNKYAPSSKTEISADLLNSEEGVSVYSLVYNSSSLLGKGLVAALASGDRLQAWYEIRYRSNAAVNDSKDINGLDNRRISEAGQFGLSNSADHTIDVDQARQIVDFSAQNYDKVVSYSQRMMGREKKSGVLSEFESMAGKALDALGLTAEPGDTLLDRLYAAQASGIGDLSQPFNPDLLEAYQEKLNEIRLLHISAPGEIAVYHGVIYELDQLGKPDWSSSDYSLWSVGENESGDPVYIIKINNGQGEGTYIGAMKPDEINSFLTSANDPNRVGDLILGPGDQDGYLYPQPDPRTVVSPPAPPEDPSPVKPLDPNVQILIHSLTTAFASLITTGSKVGDAIIHQVAGTVGGNVVEALLREQWPTLDQLLSPQLDGQGNPIYQNGHLVGGPMTLVGNIASSIGGIFGAEAGQGLFDSLGLDPKIGASLGGFLGSYGTNDLLKLVDPKDFSDLQGLSDLFSHFVGDSTTTAAGTANAVNTAANAGGDVLAAANATAIAAVVNLAFSIAMGTASFGQAATAAVDIALAACGQAWAIPIVNLIMTVIPFPVSHPTGVGDSALVDNRFEEATGMGFHDGSGEQAKAMTDVAVGALNGIISQVGGMVVGGGNNATLEFMYRGSVWYGPGGVESKDTGVVLEQGIVNAAKSLDFDGGDPMVKRAIQRSPAASMDELSADIGVAQAYTAYLNNKDVLDQAIAKDPTSDQAKSWNIILDRARSVLALDTPLADEQGTFVSYDGLELTGSVIAFDLSGNGFHPAEIAPAVLHHLSTTSSDAWNGTMKAEDGTTLAWEDGRAFRDSDAHGGGDTGENPDWVSEQIQSIAAPDGKGPLTAAQLVGHASGEGVQLSAEAAGDVGDGGGFGGGDGGDGGDTGDASDGEGGNQGNWGTRDVAVWTDNPVDPNHVTAHIAVNVAKDAGGPEGPTQFQPATVVQTATKTYAASGLSDVDGDGKDNRVSTLGPDTGVLVRATTAAVGSGVGQQSFAAVQGGASLPELLKTYDTNRDGIIDGKDQRTAELEIWRDLDRDGKIDQGELYSLAQVGITQLDFTSAGRTAIMGEGGSAVLSEGSVDVGGGHTLAYEDVRLAYDARNAGDSSYNGKAMSSTSVAQGHPGGTPLPPEPDNTGEVITGTDGNDTLHGGDKNDTIYGGAGNDSITGGAGNDSILGQDGNDTLSGGTGNDTLVGGAGNDSIKGDDGNDLLFGNAGGDTLTGGAGNDSVHGGQDGDLLYGNAGGDHLWGDLGNDSLYGGKDNDSLYGGGGADWESGDKGNDVVYGNAGADLIRGASGGDTLYGGQDNDQIFGNTGTDVLSGDKGDDTLHGGQDGDTLHGGEGADLEFGDKGNDQVFGNIGADTLLGGDGNDTLYGGQDGDLLFGNIGTDVLSGDKGDDTLHGGWDGDTLYGGEGNDVLLGEVGDDQVFGNAGADTLYGGDGQDTLYGGKDGDLLYGNAGRDQLSGDLGDDTLYGGQDNDVLFGGGDSDVVSGDAGDDYVQGNRGSDILFGGDGNDTLRGGADNDILQGGTGDDELWGDRGDDLDEGGTGSDTYRFDFTYQRNAELIAAGYDPASWNGGSGHDTISDAGGSDDALVLGFQTSFEELRKSLWVAEVSGTDITIPFHNDGTPLGPHAWVADPNPWMDSSVTIKGQFTPGGEIEWVLVDGVRYDLNALIEQYTMAGQRAADAIAAAASQTAAAMALFDGSQVQSPAAIDIAEARARLDAARAEAASSSSSMMTAAALGIGIAGLSVMAAAAETLDGSGLAPDGSDAAVDLFGDPTGLDALSGSAATAILGDAGADTVLVPHAPLEAALAGPPVSHSLLLGLDLPFVPSAAPSTLHADGSSAFVAVEADPNLTFIAPSGPVAASAPVPVAAAAVTPVAVADPLADPVAAADAPVVAPVAAPHIVVVQTDEFGIPNLSLLGTATPDTLTGGAGADTLAGLGGGDLLDGGSGIDLADYSAAPSGVSVNLALGLGSAGDALGDTLIGIENLLGGDYADTLIGDAGDNALTGGAGNDWIVGGGGADQLDGGDGIDILDYAASTSAMVVDLGAGTAVDDQTITSSVMNFEIVRGSAFDDVITAGTDAVRLIGGTGADTISGGAGDDVLEGGTGADSITGGAGIDLADYRGDTSGIALDLAAGTGTAGDAAGDLIAEVENVIGGSGNDTIMGDLGANRLEGGTGDDSLSGAAGDDVLLGGAGNDTLDGGAGIDTADYSSETGALAIDLSAGTATGAGTDRVTGIEIVLAGSGSDSLTGSAADETLSGGAGDDTLAGGAGADQLIGGAGTNTASYATDTSGVAIDLLAGTASGGDATGDTFSDIRNLVGGSGADSLFGDAADNSLVLGAGDDLALGDAGNDTIDTGLGNDLADGGDGNDSLLGAGGNDSLLGGNGDDYLSGGIGDDQLVGGAGADTLDGGAGTDIASYEDAVAGIGIDLGTQTGFAGDAMNDQLISIEGIIASSFADTLVGSGVGDVFFGRDGDDSILGGIGGDTLHGDGGADTLLGGADDDVLDGGAGADLLDGGTGINTADYTGSDAAVQVLLSTGAAHGGHAEGDVLTSIQNLTGSGFADELTGDGQANLIQGGGGADTILGGGGDDTVSGGAGDDLLDGGSGNDLLLGGAGHDQFEGGLGIDTVSYADASGGIALDLSIAQGTGGDATGDSYSNVEVFLGGSYADTMAGGSLSATLMGGGGDDSLLGGSADDQLDGGTGSDTIQGGLGNDVGLGGDGADLLAGGDGNDTFSGGDGSDTVQGDLGDDILHGDAGNDVVMGGDGTDQLYGDDGDDTLIGGAGGDRLDGGNGLDIADYTDSSSAINYDAGNHTVSNGTASGDQLISIEGVRGSAFADNFSASLVINDWFDGGAGNDTLQSGGGNDTVYGGDGNDLIRGGQGNDVAYGDAGNDQIYGDLGDDTLYGGAGNDWFDYGNVSANRDSGTDIYYDDCGDDTLNLGAFSSGEATIWTSGSNTMVSLNTGRTLTLVDSTIEHVQFNNGSITVAATGTTDPLVLDLDGDGIHLVDPETSHASFDIAALGVPFHTGWISQGDAFLVYDRDGNGRIDDVTEMFSEHTDRDGAADLADGFASLGRFDLNHDGVFDAQDDGFALVQVWQDDGDGISQASELIGLADAGIASISLAHQAVEYEGEGNAVTATGSFTRTDGTTGAVADVDLAHDRFAFTVNAEGAQASADGHATQVAGEGALASGDATVHAELAAGAAIVETGAAATPADHPSSSAGEALSADATSITASVEPVAAATPETTIASVAESHPPVDTASDSHIAASILSDAMASFDAPSVFSVPEEHVVLVDIPMVPTTEHDHDHSLAA